MPNLFSTHMDWRQTRGSHVHALGNTALGKRTTEEMSHRTTAVIMLLQTGLSAHQSSVQVTNCTAGVQQAAIPAQSATLAGNAMQGLTFNVYMQTDQGSNNSCVVTAYDSQVCSSNYRTGPHSPRLVRVS